MLNDDRLIREFEGEFGKLFQKSAKRKVEYFEHVTVVDGVPRWKENNIIPDTDLLLLWKHVGKKFDFEKTMHEKDKQDFYYYDDNPFFDIRELTQEEVEVVKCFYGEHFKIMNPVTNKVASY